MSYQSTVELRPGKGMGKSPAHSPKQAAPKDARQRGSARPKGVRRGGRIGLFRPVSIGQIALWEVALVAVAGTVYPFRTVSIVVAAVALVVVAATSVRGAGLCLYQWFGVYARFRGRRSKPRRGIDPLAAILPQLRLRRQIDRAGNRAGVADLGDSLAAVVRLTPAGSPNPTALLDVLGAAFARTDIRLAGAELVVWSMPSPPRARYYGDRRDFEPMQVQWLALRYRPADAPAATRARGGGETGAAKATASAAMALVGKLAEAGYAGVVLDEPELRQELLVALGSDHAALGGGQQFAVKETWHDWTIGSLRQITFLPRHERGGPVLLGRWTPQAAFTCTSYSLRRTARGEVRGDARVRIGVHPTAKIPTAKQVGRALGVQLLARNGRHGESVLDTLPLALPTSKP
jgi:type VII secretion protein EccE